MAEGQHKEKKIGYYLLGKTIGEGTFGKVKLATHTLTGEKVAIKILVKEKIIDVADVQRVSRQIHILKLIRHPSIIQLYEVNRLLARLSKLRGTCFWSWSIFKRGSSLTILSSSQNWKNQRLAGSSRTLSAGWPIFTS